VPHGGAVDCFPAGIDGSLDVVRISGEAIAQLQGSAEVREVAGSIDVLGLRRLDGTAKGLDGFVEVCAVTRSFEPGPQRNGEVGKAHRVGAVSGTGRDSHGLSPDFDGLVEVSDIS
jgi:hypothetical protein